ncbi:hypothetical protein C5167_019528 [Papaver somniferum]|uniref:nucleoside-diphosphate kinase n=1 Tax=Papaver somniferum TaxID=3469 RepID=A0A4Y7ITS0_PAPSO|nr:uncharacterized protein LOC113353876 isoform X1 [Papaver somniferum]XP_026453129.1 uncharacterized protein LOC113353876 isoform X2 [Papaver somniferum]XP_026453130.1 uncharacterized protein LOC113353876 isoform X3 [Papaver somniferum]RZC51102.1 hypothetical protein C5167_019528 [Papaver somniferum]
MIDHQKTFVLAYPWLFRQRSMGVLVSEFEKLKLNITEMRCMVVTPDFARKHLVNIKWDPEAFSESIPLPFASWIDCIAHGPVTAMIVEGDDAVQKVRELSKKQQLPFQVVERKKVYSSDSRGLMKQEVIELWRETVYTSHSGDQAKIDIDLWFGSTDFDETIDFEKRARESTKVVFVLPGGKTYGPLDQVKDVWKRDASYKIKQ